MKGFSEKSLLSLGDYYVYGLIDPRTNQFFYIGKGTGNRVFEHEKETINNPDSDKLKLKTISEINALGFDVKKIIINDNLTDAEAFAAEASLINAFNFISDIGLTNIVSGHHSTEALSVEEYERLHGAEELSEDDIKHKILVIKINKLYRRDMSAKELYDTVRGIWRASMSKAQSAEYVFGVYNSLIVAVYKPTKWYRCKDAPEKLSRHDVVLTPKTENRIFFVDENFENGRPHDENEIFYYGKSIAGLKLNQSAQNPITYLNPQSRDSNRIAMSEMKQVHDFALKWCDKFRDQDINYLELVDHYMADDCKTLGFEMDCGHAFQEKYGDAASEYEDLNRIIDDVTDIRLLGSAIYSQWRYFNHWAYTGSAILEPENRAWFILALRRLAALSSEAADIERMSDEEIIRYASECGIRIDKYEE